MLRIRHNGDMSVSIARSDDETEKVLDATHDRCPGELRWYPRVKHKEDFSLLKDKYKLKQGYLVGKGVSLDTLTTYDFGKPECPVIALNEAVHRVTDLKLLNDIYGLQADVTLKDSCKADTMMLVSNPVAYAYPLQPKMFVFNLAEHVFRGEGLSAQIALSILKYMGVKSIILLAFDAETSGDLNYAKCIGKKPTGDPSRFIDHSFKIKNTARSLGLTIEFRTIDPGKPSSYKS